MMTEMLPTCPWSDEEKLGQALPELVYSTHRVLAHPKHNKA